MSCCIERMLVQHYTSKWQRSQEIEAVIVGLLQGRNSAQAPAGQQSGGGQKLVRTGGTLAFSACRGLQSAASARC